VKQTFFGAPLLGRLAALPANIRLERLALYVMKSC
jgi:hypothetical protein